MKNLVIILLPLIAIIAYAEPSRDAGLSLHMLPDRVANLSNERGGFTVRDPRTRQRGKTYYDLDDLIAYIGRLPARVKANGVWVVYTHPDAYDLTEKERLDELIQRLREINIRIFTCRASELPANAWKEGKGIEQ